VSGCTTVQSLGETAEIQVTSAFAFGQRAIGEGENMVPPNSDITFEVTLVAINDLLAPEPEEEEEFYEDLWDDLGEEEKTAAGYANRTRAPARTRICICFVADADAAVAMAVAAVVSYPTVSAALSGPLVQISRVDAGELGQAYRTDKDTVCGPDGSPAGSRGSPWVRRGDVGGPRRIQVRISC
jgi:hypothetical protein